MAMWGRSYLVVVGLLPAACSFEPTPACESGACAGGAAADGAPGTDAGAFDGTATIGTFCDPAGGTLVGCWELEDTLADGSGLNNTGVGTNVTFGNGKVGNAVLLGATSLVAIADAPALSPSAITVEAWIQPTQLPATRMGIFDNNNSYGFFVLSTGGVRCTVNVTVEATRVITQLGAWTYVACTYDGTTARLYVDGAEVAIAGGGTALGTGDTSGSVLGGNSPSGDPFIGAIDQVRVFSVARSADEVCIAAGRTPPC